MRKYDSNGNYSSHFGARGAYGINYELKLRRDFKMKVPQFFLVGFFFLLKLRRFLAGLICDVSVWWIHQVDAKLHAWINLDVLRLLSAALL